MPRITTVLYALLALAATLLAHPLLADSSKRAFEISDYYDTAFVSAPTVSPDSQLIAFSVKHYDLEAGESWSDIWLMAADGTGQRQMTAGKHADSGPIFSADGRTLYFVSDRSEDSQVWKMAIDGGEPRQVTEFEMGVSDPVVSPDGNWLAVTAEVYPECGADGACSRKIADTAADGKLSVHVADELLYRHWTAWSDGLVSHILLVDTDSGKVTKDLTPGRWPSPTFSLGGSRGYDFSPDSSELTYVSNHDADQATSTNADLWTVAIEAEITEASASNLTADNHGWDGAPLYSPDGRYIAFLSQETPRYEADFYRLGLFDREAGSTRYLIDRADFDDWIDEMAWAPDSGALFFQAEQHGRTPLFRVELDGSLDKILTHAYIGGWELTPDGTSLVYTHRSIGEPHEIYRVVATGAEPVRLTTFNADLEAEVDIRPAEEMWVDGDGDYKVHLFLIKPHDFDPSKKYPLILNVHGGPQSQWVDSYRGDWQVYPGKGYIVALANPTGSSGYGQDFVDGIGCDWGGRVYRDLMKVTDALEELPYVDKEKIGAMGWSYGGYMMMWFQGHTDRFKTQVSMMGVYDLRSMWGATEELWFPEKDLCGVPWESDEYDKWSPSHYIQNFKTPTLVISGELDYRVPYTQSLQYFSALQRQQIPSRLVVFPGAGHWPSWYEMAFYYNAHLDWFHQYLGGGEAPWDVQEFARNQIFEKDDEDDDGEE